MSMNNSWLFAPPHSILCNSILFFRLCDDTYVGEAFQQKKNKKFVDANTVVCKEAKQHKHQ